jgi:hypothetical protein
MGIAKALEVIPVKVSVSQVLEQTLELPQVTVSNYLVEICVHNCPPVDSAGSLLEVEFWRKRHQTGGK